MSSVEQMYVFASAGINPSKSNIEFKTMVSNIARNKQRGGARSSSIQPNTRLEQCLEQLHR